MAKYIFKRANKKYIPLWMYIVQSLLFILEGFINLFVLPFGYLCGFTGSWSGYMLRHSFDKQKKMKEERQKKIVESGKIENKKEAIKKMLEEGKTDTEILMAVEDWTDEKYKDGNIRIGVKLLYLGTIQTMRKDLYPE